MSARLERKKMECSGWVDGWMGGSKSQVKDCLQQSIYYEKIKIQV